MDLRTLVIELFVDHTLEDFVVIGPFMLVDVWVAVQIFVIDVQVVRSAASGQTVRGIMAVPAAAAPFKRGFDSAESNKERKRNSCDDFSSICP